jgi:O-antigen/teichoic acid export membrane protein
MSPFRNVLKLSAGDLVAKAVYFLSFVYMAQKLGVANYGVLEFALAIRTYLVLLADAGLELWAIREAAKGLSITSLASRVIPARLVLAVIALSSTGLLGLVPGNPHLRLMLPLLTLTVLIQAFNLKWALMGQERMSRVAIGLMISQVAFAGCAVALVHRPADLLLIPAAFVVSELVQTVYFGRLFVKLHGIPKLILDWQGIRSMAQPVLTLGASQCLGLMNYNVDSILIGVMLGPVPVGLYAAAYKPITAVLTVAVTYYQGLFPALSRSYAQDAENLRAILLRSFRFTTIFAVPLGVGGTLLAAPMIRFLFGDNYAESVPVLQLLSWSAVLVTLRGNFRHTLNAVGRQRLDLICAAGAGAVNVGLNLLLIPRYGIRGAACATVFSEIWWFFLARYFFSRHVMKLPLLPVFWRPVLAGAGMAVSLVLAGDMQWILRAAVAMTVYLSILILSGEPEIWEKLKSARQVYLQQPFKALGSAK